MHRALLTAGTLILATSVPAQVLVGGLRTAQGHRGGLFFLEPSAPTTFQPLSLSIRLDQNPASLALDGADPTTVYVGTYGRHADGRSGPCNVEAASISQGDVASVQVLNTSPLHEDYISAVVPIGESVYYLGRRNIGKLPKKGGEPTNLIELLDWMDPRGMVSDGRSLFVAVNATEIVRIDLSKLTELTLLATVDDQPGEEIQNLALDNSGDLLVVTADLARGARLLRLDRETGEKHEALRLPLAGGRAVAQDPETDTIYVVGGDASGRSAALTIDAGKVSMGPIGDLPNALPALLVMRPRNFFLLGAGCKSWQGETAELGMVGRASTKTGCELTLKSSPNRFAAIFFALEGGGNQLIDLGPYGAAGCSLLHDAFAVVAMPTDSTGRATIRFNPAPGLGMHSEPLLAQWSVKIPGANGMGLITSDTVRIIVRE